jgi:predicted transcriptional regulator
VTIPNVVLTAALDRRLEGRDLTVYLVLFTELDVASFRAVKHAWLSRKVGMSRSKVIRAVGRLVRTGYVKRGKIDGGLRTYRIVLSPAQPQQQKERRSVPRD